MQKKPADRSPDLRNFERMGQPRSVKIEFSRKKNLRLVLQAPKSSRVKDPIAIDLKRGPIITCPHFLKMLKIKGAVKSILHEQQNLTNLPPAVESEPGQPASETGPHISPIFIFPDCH